MDYLTVHLAGERERRGYSGHVTRSELHYALAHVWERIERMEDREVTLQGDIDDISAQLDQDRASIQAELDNLQGQIDAGQTPDLSNLRSIADQLGQMQPAAPTDAGGGAADAGGGGEVGPAGGAPGPEGATGPVQGAQGAAGATGEVGPRPR